MSLHKFDIYLCVYILYCFYSYHFTSSCIILFLCHLYMSLHKFDNYFHYFMCVYFVLFKLIFVIIVPLNADLFMLFIMMLFIMFALPLYISIFPIMLCLYSPLFVKSYISQLLTALANYFYAFFKFYFHKILLGTDVVKVIFKGISIICQTFTNAT
jgi:hypothetical protein